MSENDRSGADRSIVPAAAVVAVAIRFRLGDCLPGTRRVIGHRDHVVHFAPLSHEQVAELQEGELVTLVTLCGLPFQGDQVERVAATDVVRLVGCDACQLVAPQLVLL
jgi:hypothetical protein